MRIIIEPQEGDSCDPDLCIEDVYEMALIGRAGVTNRCISKVHVSETVIDEQPSQIDSLLRLYGQLEELQRRIDLMIRG